MPGVFASRANRVAPVLQSWHPCRHKQRKLSDGARYQPDPQQGVGRAPPCISGPGPDMACLKRPPLPRHIARPSVPHRSSAEVRAAFLNFFADEHRHERVPAVSLLPAGKDEGTYFVNSGMMQFKPIFLGQQNPHSQMSRLRRACNSQRCARVGGKHNDLDDVGRDGTHLTLFEMLGSWSFGSYGRETACALAWQFLTSVLRLPPANLYVTYFGGDKELGLPSDDYTRDVWLNLGVSDSRLMPFGKKDNFWEMGAHGPCGPCTEIHFDHIGGRCARCFVNEDNPEVVEVWNLVFMEYERQAESGLIQPLIQRHVDTGMGLERMASVVQGVTSSYDTDLFTDLLEGLHARSGLSRPYGGLFPGEEDGEAVRQDVAYRVVADHLRLAGVALADGLLPAKRGVGLKMRSVLHRAIRQARERLLMPAGALADMAPVLTSALRLVRPGIGEYEEQIRQVLLTEEETFYPRLQAYNVAFDKFLDTRESKDAMVTVDEVKALMLSQRCTYDIIRVLALDRGLDIVSAEGVVSDYEKLREDDPSLPLYKRRHYLADLLARQPGLMPTRLHDVYDYFKNRKGKYEFPVQDARVLALVGADGLQERASPGETVAVLLDSTAFFPGGGGQESDSGLFTANLSRQHPQALFHVRQCARAGPFVLHEGEVEQGQELRVGQPVHLQINAERRLGLMQHHTGTHVLNFCLRDMFGNGRVKQTSSEVQPDRTVFVFASVAPCGVDKLEVLEDHARQMIRANLPVYRYTRPAEETLSNSHIHRIDGYHYPGHVHFISMGDNSTALQRLWRRHPGGVPVDGSPMACAELCSGTHLHNTADLVDLVVVSVRGATSFYKQALLLVGHRALEVRARGEELRQEAVDLVRCVQQREAPETWTARLQEIDRTMGHEVLPKVTRDRIKLLLSPYRRRIAAALRAKDDRWKADAAAAIEAAVRAGAGPSAVVVRLPIVSVRQVVKMVHRAQPSTPVLLVDDDKSSEPASRRLVCYVPQSMAPLTSHDLAHRLCVLANAETGPDAPQLSLESRQGKTADLYALCSGGDDALFDEQRLLDLCARCLASVGA